MQRIWSVVLAIVLCANSLVPAASVSARLGLPAERPSPGTTFLQAPGETPTDIPTATPTTTELAPTPTELPSIEPTATETIVPTATTPPTVAPTYTHTPTETTTITPTATRTPTGTATSVGLSTATASNLDGVIFKVEPEKKYARSGKVVELKWEVVFLDPNKDKQGWSIRMGLPSSFAVKEDNDSTINLTNHVLSMTLGNQPNGVLKFDNTDQTLPEDGYTITAQLLQNDQLMVEQKVEIAAAKTIRAQDGGSKQDKSGKINVNIAPGVLESDVDLVILPVSEEDQIPLDTKGMKQPPFKVEAYDKDDNSIHQFGKEITISVQYDPILYEGNESALNLFYYDEGQKLWVILPTTEIDKENHIIIGKTNHLSIWNPGVITWESAAQPSLNGWSVSQFTGAASYSYPLNFPAGPGGFKPNLNLTYSSSVIDNASAKTQASWVGMGWALDTGHISRNQNGTDDVYDDFFTLSMDGLTGGPLYRGTDGAWHTSNEAFYKITWGNQNYNDYPNDTWTIWDKEGNKYIFGADDSSRAKVANCNMPDGNHQNAKLTYQWNLSSITNKFGQTISYQYNFDNLYANMGGCGNIPFHPASYPKQIEYPNKAYRVVFNIEQKRTDFVHGWTISTQETHVLFQRYRLNSIEIQYNGNKDTNPNDTSFSNPIPIRKYVFTYSNDYNDSTHTIIWPGFVWEESALPEYPNSNKTLTLYQIQEFVKPTQTTANDWNALPPATFNYGNGVGVINTDGTIAYDYVSKSGPHYGDGQHLYFADNGYGGRVTFAYDYWADISIDDSKPLKNKLYRDPPDPSAYLYDNCGGNGCASHIRWFGYAGDTLPNYHPGAMYRLASFVQANNYCNGGVCHSYLYLNDGSNTVFTSAIKDIPADQRLEVVQKAMLPANSAKNSAVTFKCDANNSGGCSFDTYTWFYPTYYRVVSKKVEDRFNYNGVAGSNGVTEIGYSYDGPKMNTDGTLGGTWHSEFDPTHPYTEFIGHDHVNEILMDGRTTTTYYHQWTGGTYPTGYVDRARLGLPYQVKVTNSDGSQIFSSVDTTWDLDSDPPVAINQSINGQTFASQKIYWQRKLDETTKMYSGDINKWVGVREEYVYDTNLQGGVQYGNLTNTITSTWNGTGWIRYVSTRQRFIPNTTGVYLVGLPAFLAQYRCPSGNCDYAISNVVGITYYLYDDQTQYISSQAPSAGKLTKKRTLLRFSMDLSEQYSTDEIYEYDSWGNIITTTKYTNEGTLASLASATANSTTTQITKTCYEKLADNYPHANLTLSTYNTVCVNDGIHTYPAFTINSLNQANITFFERWRGLLTDMWDENDAHYQAAYDGYGRISKTFLPGDAIPTSPSYTFTYNLNYSGWTSGAPFWTQVTQKISDTQNTVYRKFYNGLGNLIQTQMVNAELVQGTQNVVVNSFSGYRILSGQSVYSSVSYQSIPEAVADNGGYITPSSWVGNWTATLTTTGVDGSQKVSSPGGNETQVNPVVTFTNFSSLVYLLDKQTTDAKGSITHNYVNGLGQTVAVVPPTGPSTQYAYDELGRLRFVYQIDNQTTNHVFATTELQYDLAGRKTKMIDPDMGTWSNEYDALGNLNKQIDGLNSTSCLYYDTLNRLTGKGLYSIAENPTKTCPITLDTSRNNVVTFGYDESQVTLHSGYTASITNPNGRRTSMHDARTSSTSMENVAWKYDARGRKTEEIHDLIDLGLGSYSLLMGYNNADQITTITYPDGEVVETGYNDQMLPETLTSNPTPDNKGNLVSGTLYDEQSRLITMTQGGGLTSQYAYYPYRTNGNPESQGGLLSNLTVGGTLNHFNATYFYDRNGNITKIEDRSASASLQTTNYYYDEVNRLTSANAAVSTSGKIPAIDQIFGYKPNGNLDYRQTDSLRQNYSYDQNHVHAANGLGGNTYQYDANGNMVSRTENEITYTQSWTLDNKLKKVTWTDSQGNHVMGRLEKVDTINVQKVAQTQRGCNSPTRNAAVGDCTKPR